MRNGMRTKAGLVVQTGSARETHHFALLGGYGVEAVHPWLAIQSLHELSKTGADSSENWSIITEKPWEKVCLR